MKNSTAILIILSAVAVSAIVFGAAVLSVLTDGEDQYFGMTSTKLTMIDGEETEITFWSLPDGADCGSITWTSSDSSVASVAGGTVHANSLGTAVITAALSYDGNSYKDACTVTVSNTKETKTLSYDAYSDEMDYAELSGTGFDNGLLSLTFNKDRCVVISLAGYDPSWINLGGTGKFIGNAVIDFSSITMEVTKDGNVVASTTYAGKNESSGHNDDGRNCNNNPYSALITIKGLDYGTYDVKFTLGYGLAKQKVVTGTFEYKTGDGERDASGTFTRTYTWLCDSGNLKTGQGSTRTLSITYSYSEYFQGYMKNSKSLTERSNGAYNCGIMSRSPQFVTTDGNIDLLTDALKSDYTAAYGYSDYGTQHFAQYLQTFIQTQYNYEYDNTQYYKFSDTYTANTDYWAYSDETLFSGCGDCEDTSFLLTSLYKSAGYLAALIGLPNHMMTSVSLESFVDYSSITESAHIAKAWKDGNTYYFCETTTYAPIMESANSATGITKSYYTTIKTEKTSTILVKYSYAYALVGTISNSYIGDEFEFIPV